MSTELTDEDVIELPPPLDEETLARLRARGIEVKTGRLTPFEPIRPRPRWLAFLLTLLLGPG